jgi:hypothetical protein
MCFVKNSVAHNLQKKVVNQANFIHLQLDLLDPEPRINPQENFFLRFLFHFFILFCIFTNKKNRVKILYLRALEFF